MIEPLAVGDLVTLRTDGFGGPDTWTEAASLHPGVTYRVEALPRDRRGVQWVRLDGVPAPSRRYPGWAQSRFVRVGAYDD